MDDSSSNSIKKPQWSLDVKIISHVSDMLDMAGDYAVQLETGNANALFPLKAYLQEAYFRLGGDYDSDGSMLNDAARNDLEAYFNKLSEWEAENLTRTAGEQKIDVESYKKLRVILKHIRTILYLELNRNFVKFITIYSETERMEKYSLGLAPSKK